MSYTTRFTLRTCNKSQEAELSAHSDSTAQQEPTLECQLPMLDGNLPSADSTLCQEPQCPSITQCSTSIARPSPTQTVIISTLQAQPQSPPRPHLVADAC